MLPHVCSNMPQCNLPAVMHIHALQNDSFESVEREV